MSQGRDFQTVELNDLDPSIYGFWSSVLDGSHCIALRSAQERFCPEAAHEQEIRDEFEACKNRWLTTGDPFAWYFLRLYALGQFVFKPSVRANVATFDPMYLGSGIERESVGTWEAIRSSLARPGVNLTCRNALEVVTELVESAGPETLAYLDPSYPIASKQYKMYPHELTLGEHHHLCKLLSHARFRWILSMPFSVLVHDIYLKDTRFARRLLPMPHAGHLGRSRTRTRVYEWIITNCVDG